MAGSAAVTGTKASSLAKSPVEGSGLGGAGTTQSPAQPYPSGGIG